MRLKTFFDVGLAIPPASRPWCELLVSLSAAAQSALAEVIDSFEKLELVVLLHRPAAGPRTTAELARRLSLSPEVITEALRAMATDGVVCGDGDSGWLLDPGGKWLDSVSALVTEYEDDRLLVLDALTRLALRRIRGQAAQVFADAFLIRQTKKGKPDG